MCIRTGTRAGAIAVAGLVVLAGCGGGSAEDVATTLPALPTVSTRSGAAQLESQYEQVVRAVLPSIVQITTDLGEGSGVVYDHMGNIVTNAHVVAGARSFRVTPARGGKALKGTLVGAFIADDLAVIRVNGSGLRPARFGDSAKLQVGQIVMAMGNPLGLSGSVTEGIVSALGRTVTTKHTGAFPGATIADSIQTSAAINPGNSGGALTTLGGQVVGIPTSAAFDPEMGSAAQGIGFGIPSATVKSIVPQLISNGKVTNSGRAGLGVKVRTVIDNFGRPIGVQTVEITAGGPADKAGMKLGDIITDVAGNPTTNQAELAETLANLKVGQMANIGVLRDNLRQALNVTLGELPSS